VLSFDAAFDCAANAGAPLAPWALALRGRPFARRGRGPEAYDCAGVIEHVQALLGRTVKRFADLYAETEVAAPAVLDALIRAEANAWIAGDGAVGDVLVCGRGRRAHHLAVLCGAGCALEARSDCGVAITPLSGRRAITHVGDARLYAVLRPA